MRDVLSYIDLVFCFCRIAFIIFGEKSERGAARRGTARQKRLCIMCRCWQQKQQQRHQWQTNMCTQNANIKEYYDFMWTVWTRSYCIKRIIRFVNTNIYQTYLCFWPCHSMQSAVSDALAPDLRNGISNMAFCVPFVSVYVMWSIRMYTVIPFSLPLFFSVFY